MSGHDELAEPRSASPHVLRPDDFPVALSSDGAEIREPVDIGGMTVHFGQHKKQFGRSPLMKGLPNDMCSSTHWTYLIRGKAILRTAAGESATVSAGELLYSPPGHYMEFVEDVEFVEISPLGEFRKVLEHMRRKVDEG